MGGGGDENAQSELLGFVSVLFEWLFNTFVCISFFVLYFEGLCRKFACSTPLILIQSFASRVSIVVGCFVFVSVAHCLFVCFLLIPRVFVFFFFFLLHHLHHRCRLPRRRRRTLLLPLLVLLLLLLRCPDMLTSAYTPYPPLLRIDILPACLMLVYSTFS